MNPTAAALVCAWAFSGLFYLFTGNRLATEYFAFPGIVVLTVILCKAEYCTYEYESIWHQLKCLLLERSPSDRFIMCTFPICWWLYAADVGDFTRYWALWFIAVAQLFAAGWESLSMSFRQQADLPSSGDNVSRFAWGAASG